MPLKLDDRYLKGFVSQHEYEGIGAQVKCASELLMSGKGQGNDFLGWVTLPEDSIRRSSRESSPQPSA